MADDKLGKYETQLTIQQKVYDMLLYAYPILDNFPKAQKFSLVQDLKRSMDAVLKLVITANKKYAKMSTLEKLDVELAALKVYVRMAYDLKYFMGANNYMTWSKYLVEIGDMLGGWIRAEREKSGSKQSEKIYQCSECGESITSKINDYSIKTFDKALCYKCQRKEKVKREQAV